MKTLIAYYSRTGNNEALAIEVQKRLGAEADRIEDAKSRSGPIGFLTGGMDATRRKQTRIHTMGKKPEEFDVVVVVSPLWSGLIPPAIRTYVSQNRERMKNIAFLSVSNSGEGNGKALLDFVEIAGKNPVASLLLSRKEIKEGTHKGHLDDFCSRVMGQK